MQFVLKEKKMDYQSHRASQPPALQINDFIQGWWSSRYLIRCKRIFVLAMSEAFQLVGFHTHGYPGVAELTILRTREVSHAGLNIWFARRSWR
jgi:hypothetical protein